MVDFQQKAVEEWPPADRLDFAHLVEDGVHLSVADVHVLGFGPVCLVLAPRQDLVAAAGGKSIVADTQDKSTDVIDHTELGKQRTSPIAT